MGRTITAAGQGFLLTGSVGTSMCRTIAASGCSAFAASIYIAGCDRMTGCRNAKLLVILCFVSGTSVVSFVYLFVTS